MHIAPNQPRVGIVFWFSASSVVSRRGLEGCRGGARKDTQQRCWCRFDDAVGASFRSVAFIQIHPSFLVQRHTKLVYVDFARAAAHDLVKQPLPRRSPCLCTSSSRYFYKYQAPPRVPSYRRHIARGTEIAVNAGEKANQVKEVMGYVQQGAEVCATCSQIYNLSGENRAEPHSVQTCSMAFM